MKRLRWQIVVILLTGIVVGVLLITQKAPSTQNPLTGPEPVSGGVYSEGLIGSIQRLNPLLDRYNQPDRDIDRLLFSGLVRFDSRGAPQADLAEWGVSQDGTTYNFLLKKDAIWHDGQPITSDDVVFTYNLLKSQSRLVSEDMQAFWKDVEIRKLDERNFQFLLPEAFAPFLDYLTIGILPQHLLSTQTLDQMVDADFNLRPVGSGPYRFDHMLIANNKVIGVALASFDKYYGSKPFIPQVIFRYYPDSQSAFQAYQANEILGISQITADVLPKVLADPNLLTYTSRQPALTMV
ncbi:MAG: ABC transporter substrate-binding protein, partial [Anaerolineaceae bacterium]|nr:ABC transporter substrate-binding protein [Anaerolineaceae bacterium]